MDSRDAALRRAEKAGAVLKNETFIDAWDAYERRILDALANADLDVDKVLRLQGYLVAARKARQHLERLVQDGKLAATEIELEEKKRRLRDIFKVA